MLDGNTYAVVLVDPITGEASAQYYDLGRPVINIWAGEVDGDGQPEIVPSPAGGSQVFVVENDFSLAWQTPIDGEVGLTQGGDVDGDGQAEVIALTTAWDLFC